MKTYAKWLNEKEQSRFVETFYDIAPEDLRNDLSTMFPFGCPWTYNEDEILIGETVEKMAENFYLQKEFLIIEILEEAKNMELLYKNES